MGHFSPKEPVYKEIPDIIYDTIINIIAALGIAALSHGEETLKLIIQFQNAYNDFAFQKLNNTKGKK